MPSFVFVIIVLKFVWSLISMPAFSKYVEGHLIVAERWFFITRFCFLSEDGQFEYYVEYGKEYEPQNILLYYDSDDQWPSVYKSTKTCEEKEAVLRLGQHQIINLTENEFASGCTVLGRSRNKEEVNSSKYWRISCHNARRFHSSRPRWWFLAISHCNSTNGLNLNYKLLMTNGLSGDIWREHFSADEFYILPLLSTFFVIYIIIILTTIACSVELKSRQLLHSTYKLFTISVILQEVGIILLGIAYIRYAIDGIGFPGIKTLGRISESASEVVFLLLLLLLAKGYTITRGRLTLSSSVKLTIFMCMYAVTTICLFIYEQHVFDPGEVLYLYESPAGYGLMILRIVAWWMFEYSTIFTLKHYPEKSNFYYPFNLMGTLWFIAGPCFILTANGLIDKWVRESIVYAVYHFISLTGHVLFLLLTAPSKANKNFPYHVRTSQIGAVEMMEVANTNDSLNFSHHPYAVHTQHVTRGSTSSFVNSDHSSVIRTPNVPVDLFAVHQTHIPVRKEDRLNISNHNYESTPRAAVTYSANNLPVSAPTSADNQSLTEQFIAPSLRNNNRTLSA